jgi:hypothetical protein
MHFKTWLPVSFLRGRLEHPPDFLKCPFHPRGEMTGLGTYSITLSLNLADRYQLPCDEYRDAYMPADVKNPQSWEVETRRGVCGDGGWG